MLTVIETHEFQTAASGIWSDEQLWELVNWLSVNPDAGDLIPGTRGLRKLRWSARGHGKRSGARVIYFTRTARGELDPHRSR